MENKLELTASGLAGKDLVSLCLCSLLPENVGHLGSGLILWCYTSLRIFALTVIFAWLFRTDLWECFLCALWVRFTWLSNRFASVVDGELSFEEYWALRGQDEWLVRFGHVVEGLTKFATNVVQGHGSAR